MNKIVYKIYKKTNALLTLFASENTKCRGMILGYDCGGSGWGLSSSRQIKIEDFKERLYVPFDFQDYDG